MLQYFTDSFLKLSKHDADLLFWHSAVNLSIFFQVIALFTMNTANVSFESLFWKVLRLNLSVILVYWRMIRQPNYAVSKRIYLACPAKLFKFKYQKLIQAWNIWHIHVKTDHWNTPLIHFVTVSKHLGRSNTWSSGQVNLRGKGRRLSFSGHQLHFLNSEIFKNKPEASVLTEGETLRRG